MRNDRRNLRQKRRSRIQGSGRCPQWIEKYKNRRNWKQQKLHWNRCAKFRQIFPEWKTVSNNPRCVHRRLRYIDRVNIDNPIDCVSLCIG